MVIVNLHILFYIEKNLGFIIKRLALTIYIDRPHLAKTLGSTN